ncbi:AbrB/MazE/SpoVT family DNA-binding domain-containing protein [Clostridium beijerinckii]|uniref:Transcriptional pleiotropic regulator of transition state genes n=1 Tax=Clostridium beijerinckii TaxID=1520 RepID=A0AAE5LQ91_CLOBE|nr:AbrB/MazE/SpoVT family DNA-binding domain-containing protein [Clostridium beijerinckii]NRT35549.1 transcriptional pleiotropic regulator of transition state genes [Clostridium beijerinckii]NRT45023.1 transcriptional pleiotropic regulator of transition state genes [Clostridium beijerinckii]NRZ20981.1 transcriptional pleiotropic regulator of transition state genes [Clostridium beijerinckii]NSB14410.1 transcriptional pleiotropic regulator of transition state genes [Clostridium beijerinckii]OOM3
MKTSGIVRKIDNVGRLVIPKEIRSVMKINYGDPMEIIQVNNEIAVRKYNRGCIFCGNNKDVMEFRNSLICRECEKALKEE